MTPQAVRDDLCETALPSDEADDEDETEDSETQFARLKMAELSTQHLLCLMEIWFDRTQPIVNALAEFNYSVLDGGRIGCPFCLNWYEAPTGRLIIGGFQHFKHDEACPVLQARNLRSDMLES